MTVRSGLVAWLRESSAAHIALAAAVLVFASLAAYHNSFSGAFVLDDESAIENNASIRQLWPPGPVLAPPSDAGTAGRPLANFTFALNYAASGLDVWSYHAANVALQLLAALTLFGVIRRTLLQPSLRERFGSAAPLIALASAGLWAVHPLQTEAVDYLAQRTEELMGVCYLLTLYGFIRGTAPGASPIWPALTVIACLLGMASKETMATAPLIVLLYDRTFVAGTLRGALRQHGRLHAALGATWLALAALMTGSHIAERGVGYDLGVSGINYALTQCRAVLLYLRLAFWPHPLVFDYGWDFARNIGAVAPAAAVLGALLAVAGWAVVRRPALGFLGAWFFVLLAPSSSVVPITEQPIAESRMFLPLAALTTLAVIGAFLFAGRRSLLVWTPVALVLGAATVHRHAVYRSALSLWSDTVAKRPDNARAQNNLGSALTREPGRAPEAAAHFQAALQLRPDYADAHNNLGVELQHAGRNAEAIGHFQAALRLNPGLADAHYNLGLALATTGRGAAALAHFEFAAKLNPADALTHNNLGAVFFELGRVAEALHEDEMAVRLAPNFPDARYNLGNALARAGRIPEAIEQFAVALRLRPDFDKAHNNLGTLLLQSGRVPQAIAHFEAALRINPNYTLARNNLAHAVAIRDGAPPR